jgi:hypothetical protein
MGLQLDGRKKSLSSTGTKNIALQETGPTFILFTGLTKGELQVKTLFIKHSNWAGRAACFPKILSFLPGVIQWQ